MSATLLALSLILAAQSEAPTSTSALPDVRFDTSSATVWVGRNAVLGFACDPAAEGALSLPCSSSDPGVLEVLAPASVLAGASAGTLRVRGVAAGVATLRVSTAEVDVYVEPLVAEARAWQLEPELVSPVLGALSAGTVSVGVEVLRPDARAAVDVVLELPDGRRLEPLRPLADDGGLPTLRRRFELDVDALAPGTHQLRAVVLRDGQEHASAQAPLEVVRAAAGSLAGECEDALAAPRPEEYGQRVPLAGAGAGASAGAFVVLPRNDVQWVVPIEVAEAGRYQFFVRARGDLAGGAYPSLAVSVDAASPPLGTARLVDHRWQRLPVCGPLELTAGEHHIALRLLNDLNVGQRSNRELFIDAWELVRIEPADEDEDSGVAGMMMMAEDDSQRGPSGPGLWVGLERPLDGLEMTGRLWIQGAANWSGSSTSDAPQVELVVDGEVHAAQQTAKPSFALDRAHLGEGEHELYLRASLPDGRSAQTPAQRISVSGPVAAVTARDMLRFDVLDERWDGAFDPFLDGRGEEARQRVVRPQASLASSLRLPDELSGRFELVLEARAGGADRPARATVRVRQAGELGAELETGVRDWWSLRSFGRVELSSGPKSLELRLEPHDEEPELRVRGLILRSVREEVDRRPPNVRLAYPSPGHAAYHVDAAVVEAFDDDGLAAVDAVIDGHPQGTFGHVPPGAGRLLVPLLLRDLAPGAHTLSVRVLDSAGNMAETEPIPFTLLAEEPLERGRYARAVHLLNRLAFGPDPAELCELLSVGEDAWLASALAAESPGDEAARGFAEALLGDRLAYDAARLVLTCALRTNNPVRARFALWVDNHFSTWAGKTGAPSEWFEYRDIARMGWAPFGEHLRQSATSASMLVYLDQDQSYAGRLNENYARELLELHTVGVDAGYDQADVGSLALMLAGLTVSQEAPADGSGRYQRRVFRFEPELSDGRACTLFGRAFAQTPPAERFDRYLEVLELIERRPETARFIAGKLAEHYVSAPAPEALVEHLAEVFARSGGDPRQVLPALVQHPAFWEAAEEPRLTTPLDYALRVARVTGNPAVDWSIRQYLQNSGMGIFDHVSPDGYPDDDASWADTNGLMQRWRWVQSIPWAVRSLVPSEARRYSGGDPHAWRQRIVDHAAVRLTGWTLGDESNEAALLFFAEDESQVWQRVDNLATLVCRLPEANLK